MAAPTPDQILRPDDRMRVNLAKLVTKAPRYAAYRTETGGVVIEPILDDGPEA
jgi:hypothetical protein